MRSISDDRQIDFILGTSTIGSYRKSGKIDRDRVGTQFGIAIGIFPGIDRQQPLSKY